ncbi:MAG TPA: DinB family protein [Blastocatellia bacterium]|nr:DinB family protein [Blastocatellia bacterium]
MTKPDSTEYAPYFEKYVSLVHEEEIVVTLGKQIESTLSLIRGLSAAQGDHCYAPGKWSVKEVIGHLIDAERIFAYRAMRFARNDATPLPGFDENSFVANAGFGSRSLADLADEFEHTRKSNVYLFKHLDGDSSLRRGAANNDEISVRAIAYIIAGHELHHMEILRTRYL